MRRLMDSLHRPWVQRGIRAAVSAGLAWQIAVLLPATLSDYAFYAPLGAVIAVHPTVADSASAAWRTVTAMSLGFALAVGVFELTREVPNAITIALIVILAVVVEQWKLLREQASWVSFAAVLMITVGTGDPATYALRYAGLTLLGAAVGVAVTTLLFPPMLLTKAVDQLDITRGLIAAHLVDVAAALRRGGTPSPEDWEQRGERLDVELDRMRRDEQQVERARTANPRAHRWQGRAASIREQSRALDRVAVLIDDLTTLVVEFQPHRKGLDRVDDGTGWVLADTLDALAAVVRTPYHSELRPDPRDAAMEQALAALDRLTHLLRTAEVPDDEGYFALGAVAIGTRRSLQALEVFGGNPDQTRISSSPCSNPSQPSSAADQRSQAAATSASSSVVASP